MEYKSKRPGFAENMSAAQKRRNRVIKAKEAESALPTFFSQDQPDDEDEPLPDAALAAALSRIIC